MSILTESELEFLLTAPVREFKSPATVAKRIFKGAPGSLHAQEVSDALRIRDMIERAEGSEAMARLVLVYTVLTGVIALATVVNFVLGLRGG